MFLDCLEDTIRSIPRDANIDAKETFHEDMSSVEKLLERDELQFEPSLVPEVENDFLIANGSDTPWVVPSKASKSPSTQSESFKSPGEFFARRSARLEELEKSPSPTTPQSNGASSNRAFDPTIEGRSSMQNSFEKYMNNRNFYDVLAEESALRSSIRTDSKHLSKPDPGGVEWMTGPHDSRRDQPAVLRNRIEAHLDGDTDLGSLEKCVLGREDHVLVLPATIVGIQKLIHVFVANDSGQFSCTFLQQVSSSIVGGVGKEHPEEWEQDG
jgi:hypothetical protein